MFDIGRCEVGNGGGGRDAVWGLRVLWLSLTVGDNRKHTSVH